MDELVKAIEIISNGSMDRDKLVLELLQKTIVELDRSLELILALQKTRDVHTALLKNQLSMIEKQVDIMDTMQQQIDILQDRLKRTEMMLQFIPTDVKH